MSNRVSALWDCSSGEELVLEALNPCEWVPSPSEKGCREGKEEGPGQSLGRYPQAGQETEKGQQCCEGPEKREALQSKMREGGYRHVGAGP